MARAATRGTRGSRLMWTDEKIVKLKTLWAEGLTCSQIARVLGDGATRNAVIGKVTRLGLSSRGGNVATRLKPTRIRHARHVRGAEPIKPPPIVLAPLLDADGNHFTIGTIRYTGQCKFPCDAPDGDGGFILCGHPTPLDDPWCPAHHAICLVRVDPQKRAARVAKSAAMREVA